MSISLEANNRWLTCKRLAMDFVNIWNREVSLSASLRNSVRKNEGHYCFKSFLKKKTLPGQFANCTWSHLSKSFTSSPVFHHIYPRLCFHNRYFAHRWDIRYHSTSAGSLTSDRWHASVPVGWDNLSHQWAWPLAA